jgi:signal peptidase II
VALTAEPAPQAGEPRPVPEVTVARPEPGGSPDEVPRGRRLRVLLGTALVVFAVDHVTKALVTRNLALGDQFPASGPITIHHVHNTGAAFSLFPQAQALFLVVAVAVSLYIVLAGYRFGSGTGTQVILGLILGGAVANAVDRAVQGYVVDFIDLHRWPVFNVADSCIVVGIGLALLTFGRTPAQRSSSA